ncbi:MAG TPA: glutathione S-transferase, partial [Caldimonas sp.]|nr:glutathione S-transferase [Caldimonas sp.]
MQLYIGNKNYSSWSLRPWLLMTQAGIEFEEKRLRLSSQDDSDFKKTLLAIAPTGRVPLLVDEGFAVWDSLAIAEYLAERFPRKTLWPASLRERARARSLCAEMHSGFADLRGTFGMNLEASLPEVGERMLRERPGTARD